MKSDNIKFTRKKLDYEDGTQMVIYVEARGESFPIIEFVPSTKMYEHGLQKDWKDLADLELLSYGLEGLLESYNSMQLLTKGNYNSITEVYSPFIKNKRKFEAIQARITIACDTNEWE